MQILKNNVKRLLKSFGYKIVPYDEYSESIEKVRYNWIKELEIDAIIDIGANDGGFVRHIRQYFPETQIISFEPIKKAFDELCQRNINDKNFKALNYAISNYDGETEFYLCGNSVSSSILQVAELSVAEYPQTGNNKKTKVTCKKLDSISEISEFKNLFIKMDIQGAEKLALLGAESILKNTKIIYTEVNFDTMYKENVLANELIQFLFERNFRLEGYEEAYQSKKNGKFLQGNMFFRNNIS